MPAWAGTLGHFNLRLVYLCFLISFLESQLRVCLSREFGLRSCLNKKSLAHIYGLVFSPHVRHILLRPIYILTSAHQMLVAFPAQVCLRTSPLRCRGGMSAEESTKLFLFPKERRKNT